MHHPLHSSQTKNLQPLLTGHAFGPVASFAALLWMLSRALTSFLYCAAENHLFWPAGSAVFNAPQNAVLAVRAYCFLTLSMLSWASLPAELLPSHSSPSLRLSGIYSIPGAVPSISLCWTSCHCWSPHAPICLDLEKKKKAKDVFTVLVFTACSQTSEHISTAWKGEVQATSKGQQDRSCLQKVNVFSPVELDGPGVLKE